MHICLTHFSSHYVNTAAGVEKVTCEFANEMVRRGHEVTILYSDEIEGTPGFPLDERVKEINILFKDGKQVISKKLPLSLRIEREVARLFSQKKAQEINAVHLGKAYGKRIKELLEEIRPDVTVSCSIPSTKYVIEDAKSSIPLITMMHGDPISRFPQLSKIELTATAKGKALQILLPRGMDVAKQTFPNLPIYVIGNAVSSVIKEDRADLSKEKDIHTVLCVGSFTNNKNQKMLVQAFEKIIKSGKFNNWKLEFYGYDGTRYGKDVAGYVSSHNLGKCVFLKGISKEIGIMYARSDIFAILSHSEGFPLGLTEAMSYGLPAIGLKKCFGVNDLIEHGKTGFLAEDTVEDVEKALRRLMEDRGLRIQMGQEGAEFVKQYSPEIIWNEWEALLYQIVSK